jgi:hypothetical protein
LTRLYNIQADRFQAGMLIIASERFAGIPKAGQENPRICGLTSRRGHTKAEFRKIQPPASRISAASDNRTPAGQGLVPPGRPEPTVIDFPKGIFPQSAAHTIDNVALSLCKR